MLTKSELTKIFTEYNFRPLKRFGENYLIDGNIKDKIMNQAGVSKNDVVLEIGPGLGALTVDLAESGAEIFAVEKDRKAFEILKDITADKFPNLKLINDDILKFAFFKDIPACLHLRGGAKVKVMGNLPYYITTPIIEYLIENRRFIGSIFVVIQKEVASRLLATAGSDDYSSLSCFIQYYTKPAYVYTVKRTSFYPVPEVDSSLVKIDILDKPSVTVKDEGLFFRIVRGAFNQKRKSVINSLSRKAVLDLPKDKLSKILNNAGIDPARRPESLTLAEFAAISNAVALTKSD